MPKHASAAPMRCQAVVLWIDWYAYHLARFEGLQQAFGFGGEVRGIEFVGGVGVHAGLKFREERASSLPVETLLPQESWAAADKWALARKVWSRLNELQPEVVLVPGYYTLPAIAAGLWARLHGSASVLMTESTEHDHARSFCKEAAKAALIRVLFNWATLGGKAHERYLRKLGFPKHRIVRFYDVVGNDRIRQGVQELRAHGSRGAGVPTQPYFLFVGRLAAEKNVATLVKAWVEYRERGGSWSLVLAGDGPEREGLASLLSQSSSARDVIFTGLKSAQELLPLFAAAECFVLPSTREPWGLVVNEAMAASLPVIVSSRCGCVEDLVDDSNGWVVNPSSQQEIAAALLKMEALSALERRRLGANSAKKIGEYSPRQFGLEIAKIAAMRAGRGPELMVSREGVSA